MGINTNLASPISLLTWFIDSFLLDSHWVLIGYALRVTTIAK